MTKSNSQISLKTDQIFRMTDDTGMLQHSVYGIPNLSMGYTTDDNARALIMAVKLYEQHHEKSNERLMSKYISFLFYAENADGKFKNFMGYNREFLEDEGSEDCFGRCMWALCYTFASPITPKYIKKTAWKMIENALPNCLKLISPRANAYLIIGLKYLNQEKTNEYITKLADTLSDHYDHHNTDDWHWFEDCLTYSNATLPWAMLAAFSITKIERHKQIGIESLKFLESKTFSKGYFKPIGCKGWLIKGNAPAEFDEQPVEACETMLAYFEAHLVSGNRAFLDRAKICFSWYTGNNSKSLSLIDDETGGCYDAITSDGLNLNQGAESIVSFWIAYLDIKKYRKN